jgi:hypothetical protein
MQRDFRVISGKVLQLLQILYQNNQINTEQKNELVRETKSALVSCNDRIIYDKLTSIKYTVGLEFRNHINDVLDSF